MQQDLHDLVGSSLTAIVLQGEVALRGGMPDSSSPGRERGALTEIIALAQRLHDDVRSISRPDGGNPSLSDELAHAQRVLADASGVGVRTVLPPWAEPDPTVVGFHADSNRAERHVRGVRAPPVAHEGAGARPRDRGGSAHGGTRRHMAKGPAPPRRCGALLCDSVSHQVQGPSRNYLMILVTWPAPTVRPPSRMANFRPSSMATGWISATSMRVLSPGMTISVPSGRVTTPVTSVVRK